MGGCCRCRRFSYCSEERHEDEDCTYMLTMMHCYRTGYGQGDGVQRIYTGLDEAQPTLAYHYVKDIRI